MRGITRARLNPAFEENSHAGIHWLGSASFLLATVGAHRDCLLMFSVAALLMWKAFLRFDWVVFLCFGLYYLIHVPMQKGEAPKVYFSKPRTLVSFALIIAAVVMALHSLLYLFARS